MNNVLNSSGSLLDLIFPSDSNVSITPSSDPLIACDSYHPALNILLSAHSICRPFSNKPKISKHNFNKADYLGIRNYLNSIHWDDVLKDVHPDHATNLL